MAIEYDLEKTAEEQPPFSTNEVFVITHHLVAGCDMLFPTVRVLFQLNTLRKWKRRDSWDACMMVSVYNTANAASAK